MKTWFSCKSVLGVVGEGVSDPVAPDTLDIDIYDEIGGYGITAQAFITAIKSVQGLKRVNMRINSPGGSVFDGLAIYNYLNSLEAEVVCRIDGICASIASVIMCAADKVIMPRNAFIMVHNPVAGLVQGTAGDMKEMAEFLDKMSVAVARVYAQKTGMSEDGCKALMDKETWMDGEEAIKMKFADELTDAIQMAAKFDLTKFSNTPKAIVDLPSPIEQKPVEEVDAKEHTEFVPPDMEILLNAQVGREMYSAYVYFMISAAFQAKGLTGFESWTEKQGQGEISHAMKIKKYLIDTGSTLALPDIPSPEIDLKLDVAALTQAMMDQEMSVTSDWKNISQLAKQQENSATFKLAQDFIAEQIEEENSVLSLLQKVKMADSGSGILLIDSDLKRVDDKATTVPVIVEHDTSAQIVVEPVARDEVKHEPSSEKVNEAQIKLHHFKAMVKLFGEELAGKYLAKDFSLEQAKEQRIAELNAEIGKLKAQNEEYKTKLEQHARHPLIPFQSQSETELTMRVSDSEFESYCKANNITGKAKDSLRKEMCKQLEKQQNEGE